VVDDKAWHTELGHPDAGKDSSDTVTDISVNIHRRGGIVRYNLKSNGHSYY
jgi:hypothetical protein